MYNLMILLLAVSFNTKDGATIDWPTFRGVNHDGLAHASDIFTNGYGLQLNWQQPLGSGYSSVSIGAGIAVTFYGNGERDLAVAFDAHTGKKRWTYDISPAYVGYGGSYDGPIATPLIDSNRVYGIGARGELFALNAKDGSELFRLDLKEMGAPEPLYGFSASPIVAGDLLIVQTGGQEAKAGLMGLNKFTGKQIWSSPPMETGYETASLVKLLGREQLVLGIYEKLVGIDPGTGEQLWSFDSGVKAGAHVLVVDEHKIYICPIHYRQPGALVEVSRKDGEYHFEKRWESKGLGTMGIMIYRDGYIYGFNGRFLSCTDAASGERKWKSRPPGDGFAIVVEDHLAVITQKGSLHLIEASPEGYREKSSLKLFDDVVFNPPAFAHGKLYLRSMGAIAAVDVGRVTDTQITDTGLGLAPGTSFAKQIAALESAADQDAAIQAFLKKYPTNPIFEDEGYAHLLYHGKVKDIGVRVQSIDFQHEPPMRRLGESDLYYFSVKLDRDAQVSYGVAIDYEGVVADPRNPANTPLFWNDNHLSLLRMPGITPEAHLQPAQVKGRIHDHEFESKQTKVKRKLKVYVPPGYDTSQKRYPVVYSDYGFSALDKGAINNTLDHLAGKSFQEVILVLIPPQPRIRSDRDLEPGKRFGKMIVEEIVPMIDREYRTLANREHRALLGHYWLGYATLYAGLVGDSFGSVAVQSGVFEAEYQPTLVEAASAATNKDLRLLLEYGAYDLKNDARRDVANLNKTLAKAMEQKGFKVEVRTLPLADGWTHWQTRQDDLLRWMFPLK